MNTSAEDINFAEEIGERKFEDSVQREVDEAHECERALFDGKEAGRRGTAAGLNPHEIGTPKAKAWERGRSMAEGEKIAARRPLLEGGCLYHKGEACISGCNGRGLCLDVA